MARPTVEGTPRVDVERVVRDVRGGARRCRPRLPSTATVRGSVERRAVVGGVETWRIVVDVCLDGRRGSMLLRFGGRELAVILVAEPMRFGGVRWFARCPECLGRCGAVFVRAGVAACRPCHGLTYRSTRCDDAERVARRGARVLARLGAPHAALVGPTPPRPAHMKPATYERHVVALARLRERYDAEASAVVRRILGA